MICNDASMHNWALYPVHAHVSITARESISLAFFVAQITGVMFYDLYLSVCHKIHTTPTALMSCLCG